MLCTDTIAILVYDRIEIEEAHTAKIRGIVERISYQKSIAIGVL